MVGVSGFPNHVYYAFMAILDHAYYATFTILVVLLVRFLIRRVPKNCAKSVVRRGIVTAGTLIVAVTLIACGSNENGALLTVSKTAGSVGEVAPTPVPEEESAGFPNTGEESGIDRQKTPDIPDEELLFLNEFAAAICDRNAAKYYRMLTTDLQREEDALGLYSPDGTDTLPVSGSQINGETEEPDKAPDDTPEYYRWLEEKDEHEWVSLGNTPVFSMGKSSPWPYGGDEAYSIVSAGEGKAGILFYAFSSDPHYTVWRMDIRYEKEDSKFVVTEKVLTVYDAIGSMHDFISAYPHSLKGSAMDFQGGYGEALTAAAKGHQDDGNPYYKALYDPKDSLFALLNISAAEEIMIRLEDDAENYGEVSENGISVEFLDDLDKVSSATLYLKFADSADSIEVVMIKTGEGIWLPADAWNVMRRVE